VKYILGGLLACVAVRQFAPAQTGQFSGQKITRVEFPAAQQLDPRDLAVAQPIKPGETFSEEAVASAIDTLFATGRFEDIRVEAEPEAGGVAIRFVTSSQWFVGHVGAEGKIKSPPNRGQVVNASGLELAEPFDDTLVPQAEERVRGLLQRNGLYEGTVKAEIERDPEAQQIDLTFRIHSGKRARYDTPVIQGDPKLSPGAIAKATGWKRFLIGGYKQVTEQRTRGAVRGVLHQYQKKDRLMAQVDIHDVAYEEDKRRVRATFNINAGPKVKVQALEAKVSKRNLRKYVPIYDEQRVDNDLLVEGARNLRDFFQRQGYYDTDIDFRQRPEANDEVVIEYVISRGQRYKLVDVSIQGNRYFDKETIRERMFLEPAGFVRFRHGRYSEAMRKKDAENIQNLYKSNGFHGVKVTSEVTRDYKEKVGDIAVTFHVDEGPQWFVAKLEMDGVSKLNLEELLAKLSSGEGQPYSETNVAADRNSILTTYYSNGMPDTTFEWSSAPSDQPNRVNLRYVIKEGRQQYIQDVLVKGTRDTRMRLIDRRIKIQDGDPLSPLAITDSQKELYNTGVLAKVSSAVQDPEGQTAHKHVIYDIDEADRYNLNLGFGAEFARFGGASTDLGAPAGSTGFSPRLSLDLTRINLWGIGHYASIRGRVSNLDKRASFDYTAPRFQNVEGRNITFTALWENAHDVNTFTAQREEASIQISQQFTKALTGLFRYTWRYVTTSDVVIPALLIPQLLQPVRIGMLSANFAHDRRNDPTDATRGIFTTTNLDVASPYFGSERSFVRLLVKNATYHRVTRNTVLARETTFGAILPFSVPAGLSNVDAVPLPERFFGGGNSSLRAFPENQAGPRDIGVTANGVQVSPPTGFPIGGNALLMNMTEYRFPLIGDNIKGVLFHDMGNVYTDLGSISFRVRQQNLQDFNYMVHAAGFGIRYRTPIGPVRVDLAYSINPPSFLGFKGTTEELLQCNPNAIGPLPAVCTPVQQRISHFQFFFSIGQTF
jgi:outer membrane protein assembly complex protein YaeT